MNNNEFNVKDIEKNTIKYCWSKELLIIQANVS